MSDLPKGWTETPLDNVIDVLDRLRIPVNAKERAKRPGTVPYYGATGQVGTINEALFDEELVLLGEDGAPFLDPTKRKAYIIDGPSWVNNHAHVLRAIKDLTTNRFLKHQLDAIPYADHVNGTTRLKLTQKAMRAMPFRLPPLAEQERIVAAIEEYFSHLDAAQTTIERVQRQLRTIWRRLLNDLIEGSGPLRSIEDIAKSEPNSLAIGPFGSNLKVADYREDGVPLVFVRDIRAGLFGGPATKFVTEVKAPNSPPSGSSR